MDFHAIGAADVCQSSPRTGGGLKKGEIVTLYLAGLLSDFCLAIRRGYDKLATIGAEVL
jgi:hypothetical protein